MDEYTYRKPNSSAFQVITGETFVDAIESHIDRIIRDFNIGNAAGATLKQVVIAPDAEHVPHPRIHGKKPPLYTRVFIDWIGMPLAHRDADPEIKQTIIRFDGRLVETEQEISIN